MRGLALTSLLFFPSSGLADVFPFSTPSRNIECSVGLSETASDIACTIFEKGGPEARPRPSGCSGPWGHHFSMVERGPVTMKCGGPGRKNNAKYVDIAEYGVTGRFGGITCLSQKNGFECRNSDGHGFFLSRARQTVY